MRHNNIVLAAALLLALNACGKEDEHDTKAAQQLPSVPQTTVSTPAPAAASMSVTATDARIAKLQLKASDCNIENANDKGFEPDVPSVSRSEPVSIAGWVIDAKAGVVPKNVRLRVEAADAGSAWEQPVVEWGDRSDVVTTHGNNTAFQKAGFVVLMNVGQLPVAAYNLYLNYDTPDGDVSCAVGRRLVLEN